MFSSGKKYVWCENQNKLGHKRVVLEKNKQQKSE